MMYIIIIITRNRGSLVLPLVNSTRSPETHSGMSLSVHSPYCPDCRGQSMAKAKLDLRTPARASQSTVLTVLAVGDSRCRKRSWTYARPSVLSTLWDLGARLCARSEISLESNSV